MKVATYVPDVDKAKIKTELISLLWLEVVSVLAMKNSFIYLLNLMASN